MAEFDRCSKVVSNLRDTGHQINVFVPAAGHAVQRRSLIPPIPSAARQPVKSSVRESISSQRMKVSDMERGGLPCAERMAR
jgi:hypothetical protein